VNILVPPSQKLRCSARQLTGARYATYATLSH
jgi:hypothetical protein